MIKTGLDVVDWKRVDLNLLVAFYHLYQTQSVSDAAAKSYVSQSAMSHSLSKLRVLCHDTLFERKGHKMVPTERASELFPTVQQILNLFEFKVLPKQEFLPKEYDGVCKIGLTDYAEFIFAPIIYDAVMSQAPKAKLRFINVNRDNYTQIYEQENLDIMIGSITDLDSSFSSQILYTEQHVCIYDASVCDVTTLDIATFVSKPHCLVSPNGQFHSPVDKYLDAIGEERTVKAISRNFLTIGRLVHGREMFAIVPKKMAEISLMQAALTAVPPPVPVADFDITLIWKAHLHMNHKVSWLRDALYESIVEQLS
ncbi:LysR family transcriptional regulator [Vibrio sp. 10N.286.49.C2]|uniref:LysR family transcriptional regulator n=1 Tax=unclassified Vibrio TaxID=2614977 RepID=UPI000C84D83E|nr:MULTISPECIES: LysR family transcriptional regulator [unclassified Vibrio]PMH29604.1 LysR family transcriptional regulator [Vibrio sp. 10N.286.49.C2]PMH56120.1 LysR family transcriptional regulator [Vibrio sp. 10N.286.49.B1]PMH81054.1 LysR family transcriptional regulator [Vibrio sp. 10N.286.48.B7]